MAMPWQPAEGLKHFRKLKLRPRPIAEKLPHININDLQIPTDDRIHTLPNISFTFPFLASIRLSRDCAEFNYPSYHRNTLGRRQTFRIQPFRVGYGVRHSFQAAADEAHSGCTTTTQFWPAAIATGLE
jgi:hypothetical protein